MKKFEQFVKEANKSGDASLHDWFSKSKSSDGKPGWVQLGGRYAGKSCAKQPGQTTKPKCGSSKMAASMSDKEEDAAARRKREQDPDANRSGQAINVPTEGKQKMKEEWSQKYKSSINCSHPKGFSQKAHCAGKKKQNEDTDMEMICGDCGMCQTHGNHSHDTLGEACWAGYEKKGMKTMFGKRYPNCVKKESIDEYIAKSECPECGGHMVSEDELTEEKDACYHKVKSRYSVWPSAYASGALVKCRKAGAANWGNKTKQEGVRVIPFKAFINEAANAAQQAAIAINMKKKGIKPKNEEVELDESHKVGDSVIVNSKFFGKQKGKVVKIDKQSVHVQRNGKKYSEKYPHDSVMKEEVELDEVAAWQRKEGKNPEGGLNQKGIASYRAENPGSKLSTAVTTEPSKLKPGSKAANRRKSFCARMGGMKKRLTSAKTANDPDSRINKALRKWNC
jgi:hypothetical protein